jgi:hypothetical protein
MIKAETRLVKRLRLTGPTDSSVRRGHILVEDALRTASLPDAIGSRVLVIRSLTLPAQRTHESSASLALAIERAFLALESQAVHAEDQSADTSSVVYFKDELEPYLSLALRLSRGSSATHWFWPLAVSGWSPALPKDEALRLLLTAALRTQPGVAAAVVLIRELLERDAVRPLLGALRLQEGPALLRACGWTMANQTLVLAKTIPSLNVRQGALHWEPELTIWFQRWGPEDARSHWLAAVALAAENSGRLKDPRLMGRAREVIQAAIQTAQQLPAADQTAPTEKKRSLREEAPPLPSSEGAGPTLASDRDDGNDGDAAQNLDQRSEPQSTNREIVAAIKSEPLNERASPPKSFPSTATKESQKAPDSLSCGHRAVEPRECPEEFSPPTAYAGLFFLIPLLSKLGLPEALETNPNLIEFNLPERLLSFVGASLGIPDGDPAISFLAPAVRPAVLAELPCEFIVPVSRLKTLCHPGSLTICRMRDEPLVRTLCDSSGELTLALWRGPAPESVRALIGGEAIKHSLRPRADDFQVLLESWLVAMRRWCRAFLRIGLSDLVCRAGRVSQTSTHIDVRLDCRQADVRVRKAGLDLNPGWVAWLGRVVTFYYSYGEQGYG